MGKYLLKGPEIQMEIEKLQSAVEAILFTMGDSVELSKIAAAIGHDEETTRKLIHNMMDRYNEEDRGIRIIELEDSYQLCTKKEMYEYLNPRCQAAAQVCAYRCAA